MSVDAGVLLPLWVVGVGVAVIVDVVERRAVDLGTVDGLARLAPSSSLVATQVGYRSTRMVDPRELWLSAGVAATLVAIAASRVPARPLWGALAAVLAVLGSRAMAASEFSNQGSDHMRQQMLLCVVLGGVPWFPEWVGPAAATGVALAAYASAGAHKLRSGAWRDGSALTGVLFAFGARFELHSGVAAAAGWVVLSWELLVPFALVIGVEAVLVFLAVGAGFHLANAVLLGLSSFLWIFLASYPAIVWTTLEMHG